MPQQTVIASSRARGWSRAISSEKTSSPAVSVSMISRGHASRHGEPLLELRAGRQARDHALVLDHVRAGRAAPADGLERRSALGERDGEGRAERVAGAGACPRRVAGNAGTTLVAEPRALLAERDDQRAVVRPRPPRASVSFGVR